MEAQPYGVRVFGLGAVINHDSVAVIDDIQRRGLVIELDGLKVGLSRTVDINRSDEGFPQYPSWINGWSSSALL
jgi:hypothetical protein